MNTKGAGRKPLESGQRRAENIRVRLTKSELHKVRLLHKKVATVTLSDLVRTALFKEKLRVQFVNPQLQWAMHDMAGLGNQIGKLLRSKNLYVVKLTWTTV